MSQGVLNSNNLHKFAAIDIVPDKTMRIILTGDLLFDLGKSELSGKARASLQKVVAVVQRTPYMINVVGHTDNLPMRSSRFISNWELSVARASSVARFLIDEMEMNPNQFVVSGYSSYRPIAPNTTAENRSKNRRVEIIISKRLPNPLPATAHNLK
jgi:chemotaxis protein MotB